MGKLTAVRSRLGVTKPRVGFLPGDRQARDQERDTRGWRRWYKTGRWQRLRMAVLIRDMFTCQWAGCGRIEGDTSELVADHREPHRGDERLFWDEQNLWCLCKPCHDSAKQRQERGNA